MTIQTYKVVASGRGWAKEIELGKVDTMRPLGAQEQVLKELRKIGITEVTRASDGSYITYGDIRIDIILLPPIAERIDILRVLGHKKER